MIINPDDILANFDMMPNKENYWFLMRFMCIILDIYRDIKIELHPPRITNEMFVYHSDKYWSRIVYAWNELQHNPQITKNDIFNCVHIGGSINYLDYWYDIFKKQNTFTEKITNENKYYVSSLYDLKTKTHNDINYLIEIDQKIADVLYHIKNYKLNKQYCKYMIALIIDTKYISQYIIDTVYNYLSSDYIDPRVDSEKRYDLLVLFYDFLDI